MPLYDANNSDDVIYGGWDNDFLHGAAGDDAMLGGEAPAGAYSQRYDAEGNLVGIVRSDWDRPYNPGNLLNFGADFDPWHSNQHNAGRLGEFALYDEYDPRRTILLKDDGTASKDNSPQNNWFLNFASGPYDPTDLIPDEGRDSGEGPILIAPNGTVLATGHVATDGNDVMYGDLGNDWIVGGSGRDTLWAGWGNDLLNVDDALTIAGDGTYDPGHPLKIQPSPNDTPDTHPSYEDRAYGGAGLDILIGNTGGDRLIDWVGEHNSYIVPFAPFGIATVSRQVEPQLPEFLYALSFSQGVDPTRDTDTGRTTGRNIEGRNGEYEGELGVIIQQDHGYWQQQTGGPTDPQAGNVPGGRRDVLRSADFNNSSLQGFAVDSGAWTASGGTLQVAAESLGQDAAAVFYADVYLPIYYELVGSMMTQKPTGGWKSNSYVLFDYWSPTDFKFAGIDIAINKMVIGHRTPSSWVVDAQAPFTGALKEDRFYQILVAVNGTMVTVSVDNAQAFSHTFAPRDVNGQMVGLNKGLVGFGSDNSKSVLDNLAVQALPPNMTLNSTEYFEDGTADQFTGPESGTWTVSAGRYSGTPVGSGIAIDTLDLGVSLQLTSYREPEATLSTTGIGGMIFDSYGVNDYKFVALDVPGQRVLVGHVDPRRGWTVDATFAKSLTAGVDYVLTLALQGTVVTPTLNGAVLGSVAYNAGVSDGKVGTLSKSGTTSFDRFQIRTNDPAFNGVVLPPEVRIGDAVVNEGASGSTPLTLTLSLTSPVSVDTTVGWHTIDGTAIAGSDYLGVTSGTATFAAGSSSATIQVNVLGDGLFEANETFSVELTSWAGLNLADKVGVATITNDDLAPVVSISATDASGAEQGQDPVKFTVTRSTNLVGAATVNLAWGGTAAAADYTASTSAGGTISGNTLTIAAGVGSVTVTITPVDDIYTEPTETVSLSLLAGSGYNLSSPTSASGSITDNDAPAVVSLAATDAAGAEQANDPVAFTLTRSVNANWQLAINLAWSGAATYGTDYTVSVAGGTLSANGTQLTLPSGVLSASITVTPVNDTAVELTESVTLTLAAGANYTVGSPSSATGNITDNDLPALSIGNASVTEGNNGTKTVAVAVTLSAATSATVTVSYQTVNGTAAAPSDYQAVTPTTLTFAPGVTSRTINVTINGDRVNEANETFQVVLSNPTGATIGTGAGTVTIINDDNALMAATAPVQQVATAPVFATDLAPIVVEAKRRLALTGLDNASLSKLDQVTVQFADLDGLLLGLELDDTVLVDSDAAGHGWFIDRTPGDDWEFVNGGVLTATTGPAAGRMDFLTVVAHELGHAAGLDHDDDALGESHDLMAEQLTPGTRRLETDAMHRTQDDGTHGLPAEFGAIQITAAGDVAASALVLTGFATGRPLPIAAKPYPDPALAFVDSPSKTGAEVTTEMARLLASRNPEPLSGSEPAIWQVVDPDVDGVTSEGLLVDFSKKSSTNIWNEDLDNDLNSLTDDELADTLDLFWKDGD
jgi:hypothetical protein